MTWLRRSLLHKVRPLVEMLEDRVVPSWGSTPPATITPPSSYTSVNLNSAGDASGSAAITSNEIDWYKFTVGTGGSFIFDALKASGSSVDTVAAIYTSTGSRVAYNDDSNGTTNSHFTATLTAGATYYFGVTNYTGTANGNYTWNIDGPASSSGDDAYEENDSMAAASNLGTLTSQQTYSNLKMADSQDWFKFTMNGAGTTSNSVSIAFTHANGDLDMRLYNSAGTEVGNSQGTSNSETISLNGLAAGTYYVKVYGYNGVFNPNYSLTVNPGTGTSGGGYVITLRITGMSASQQQVFQQAAARWQQIITAALPAATYNGTTTTGVIIDASGQAIDGAGGILGQAGPDRFRTGSSLPYHGVMQFDTADLAQLESSGGLIYTITHEMGHVLGIGTIWSTKGLLSGAGGSNPIFTGAQATAQYNAIFGTSATGVPVENTGGSGTRDSHWRESTFNNELMTGWLNSGVNPLSRVTVASLADLGYTVNINAADGYTPPGGGGGGTGGSGGGGSALRAGRDFNPSEQLERNATDLLLPAHSPRAELTNKKADKVAGHVATPVQQARQSAMQSGLSFDAWKMQVLTKQRRAAANSAFAHGLGRLGSVADRLV
jgi:hypothetical protein